MITRASELGVHPTAEDVDKWFLNHQGLHNSISMERISLGKVFKTDIDIPIPLIV